MNRWLFDFVSAVALLLSLTGGAAWAMSYAQPLDWHLLALAHSADLERVNLDLRAVVQMKSGAESDITRYGFFDALWARSESGRLSLVAHYVDYDGGLRSVHATPPSLTVEVPGPAHARAVAFSEMPDTRSRLRRMGFAWEADVQHASDGDGTVSVRAQLIVLPHWVIVLSGLPPPLLWLRANRATRRRT